jgi:hypothetical protein
VTSIRSMMPSRQSRNTTQVSQSGLKRKRQFSHSLGHDLPLTVLK